MMKSNPYFIVIMVLFPVLISLNAHAHGRYFRGGYPYVRSYDSRPSYRFYFGFPLYGPAYYTWPYYYPPAYTMPAPPANYVQRGASSQIKPLNPDVWHYSPDPDGFYPHVPSCPGGSGAISSSSLRAKSPGLGITAITLLVITLISETVQRSGKKSHPDGGQTK